MDTQSPNPGAEMDNPPSLGERLSITFAVLGVWLFGWLFVGIVMAILLPLAVLAPLLFYGALGGYVLLGVGAACYVFANPRRPKVPKKNVGRSNSV